ncbi:GGDEF domain-containing protein [Solirubrobacter soli]|uniref:GGDEF domain-containing protein n=1 Tax=Solirubrobacter soli TaxID=363832 RepID=UPI00042440BC|nr:GGDEF domain-containing protein [Solirubrobacter soli]
MIAKSGAAMYAGAAAVGAIESIVAGRATSSPIPILISFAAAALLWNFGGRLDRRVLMLAFGPIGVVLIAIALATSPPGNGDVMYAWSVLCVASFFGTRETVAVVLTVAIAQTAVVLYQPGATFDHWCDPVASMAVIAIVVRGLAARNARLVARLTRESRIDPLTGLLNRRGLEERFAVELARSKRDGRPLSVVAVDIDHFKRINDEHGHQAGDRTLVWLAAMLCEQTRGADIVARVGGEEFVIVLPGADGTATLEFAERLREAIEDGDAEIPMTISAGVASALAPSTAHTLLDAADRALYAAKHAGRNRVSYTRS